MLDQVARLLTLREQAVKRGDRALVVEINQSLRRYGYVDPPPKRRPGRPRKAE